MSSTPIKKNHQLIPVVIVTGIILVFLLGFWGYYDAEVYKTLHATSEETYDKELHLWNTLYAILGMFLMGNLEPNFQNWQIILASFLAALILGFGIIQYTWNYVTNWWTGVITRYFYSDHSIILGNSNISFRIANELLADGQKVVIVEKADKVNENLLKISSMGGKLLGASDSMSSDLIRAGIKRAKYCLVLGINDEDNMQTANLLSWLNRTLVFDNELKVLIYVEGRENNNFLKDYMDKYNRTNKFDIDAFNADLAAAKLIYDTYPPLSNVDYETVKDEEGKIKQVKSTDNAILILGLNRTAEMFLLENYILSHRPGLKRLKVILIDKDIKNVYERVKFKFPFIEDYLDIETIEYEDEVFYSSSYSSNSFIKKLKLLSGVYIFGDNDAKLIGMSNSFRQLLYSSIGDLNDTPIVTCLPEKTRALALLNPDKLQSEGGTTELYDSLKHDLNINFVRLFTDTCTKTKLIDQLDTIDTLSKVINYFYSMKYEFRYLLDEKESALLTDKVLDEAENAFINVEFTSDNPLNDLEDAVLSVISNALGRDKRSLKPLFAINYRWNDLTDIKQESNRYVARHLNTKTAFIRKMGHRVISKGTVKPYYKIFAPVEHARWCSEKLAFRFRYGKFPSDNSKAKKLLKDDLKIHDQLIPYEQLTQEMEDKDFNMFLMIPTLEALKKKLNGEN
ncbi:NAD-binding protein [Flammeovirgaceae bacterium SG7u.111]|nr:NAD-binding protein [Flammeovirgaceae bacterium SG7u.132]WPO37627.1 NAD-binding protein [Flammeovirgaceae bacterium SG7u.111]